jgi:hypothetical protein
LVEDLAYAHIASTAQLASSPKRGGRRSPSPSKLSPEVNRALARELYIESTVNVVNPSKGSPSKIRPG